MARFQHGLAEALPTSRRDADAVILTQAKGVVRTLLDVTPPGGKNVRGTDAKRRGERAVTRDVNRVVVKTRSKKAQPVDVRALVDAKRIEGRVRTRGTRIAAPSGAVTAEIQRRKRRVGRLSAGWMASANEVGVRVPAWISRHPGEGRARLHISHRRLRFQMTNATEFASDVTGLPRRIQYALDAQGGKMVRAARHYWERKFEKEGFRTR